MNIYRLIGDALHLISILILLRTLIKTKSCGGVSGKTQLLFAIVYSTRYLDLFTTYISAYNSSFKVTYILSYYIIVLLIFCTYRKSYKSNEDTFLTELLLTPCFLLSIYINHEMTPMEILWTFSTYLEAVAILPQFYMIFKKREIEATLIYYLAPLAAYKLMYISNWMYRYIEEHHYDMIAIVAGVVYVTIYFLALITFCAMEIKITYGDSGRFFTNNIFFISGNEQYNRIENEQKSATDEVITV